MMNLGEWWERVTGKRYTKMLEDEVSRLRAENRALLNSIIGIAGVPPLKIEAEIQAERETQTDRLRAERAARKRGFMLPLNRLRRRSWQQIGRMLEMEEVRKLGHRESPVTMQPAVRS